MARAALLKKLNESGALNASNSSGGAPGAGVLPPGVLPPNPNAPGMGGVLERPEGYHYYQFIPGHGYFLVEGIPGEKPVNHGKVAKNAAEAAAAMPDAPVVTLTTKGCKCRKSWSFQGIACDNYCCNPDNEPNGPWCFVEDGPLGEKCQSDNWGTCGPVPTALIETSLLAEAPKRKHLRASFLEEFTKENEGDSCPCYH